MATKTNIDFPSPQNISIEVKLEGEWQRVEAAIGKLSPDILKGYEIATNKYANKLLRIIKRAVLSGTPPPGGGVNWPPLSPDTIKRYGDHPIYNLTGTFSKAIGFFHYKSRTYVGLPLARGRSSSGGLTLNQLAKLLEFGGTHIPPRPLWGPSFKAAGGIDELRRNILTEIRRKLGSSFGIRPNQVKW